MYKVKGMGWRVDLPDSRDHLYQIPKAVILPSSVDLRSQCPPIEDQGNLGSCVSCAIAGALEFNQMKAGNAAPFLPSRLFIYFNGRVLEHTVKSDSGLTVRDGIKTIASTGVCNETLWPYIISKFRAKPPQRAYQTARTDLITGYSRLDNTQIDQLKACLASGFPFVFGFTVYQSFESQAVASSGIVPMPQAHETPIGGHCIDAVGYSDTDHWFICRNSWGPSFGDKGYVYMPYAYLTNPKLAADFWQISSS